MSFFFVGLLVKYIYRMYIIWGYRRKIVLPPLAMSCLNHAFGIFSVVSTIPRIGQPETEKRRVIFESTFFALNMLTNLVITSLNAWRIWKITQQVETLVKPSVWKRYHHVVAITLESGIAYTIAHIALIVVVVAVNNIPVTVIPLFVLVAATVPTVIIVRAGLGVAVENAGAMATSFHVASVVDSRIYTGENHRVRALDDLELQGWGHSGLLEGAGRETGNRL
ncbi:hypothetical protein K435DRAFT_382293 [Dendrothele bispora CBS 962.96]|uniref:Uncharacterized protein n=1 Tax=Dendrothele bispora (strain CBS 962.96) TaxID=1314807 RepID=A0A4S8MVW8_DENBC|nr:hypothetical protein K435DRAFT_382293 [Dendrothele bispora CBS 962.96]